VLMVVHTQTMFVRLTHVHGFGTGL
jgi:hypothetical protein